MNNNKYQNKYNMAPLPFQGQKRFYIKTILQLLADWQNNNYITKDMLFLDVFGGSGLISHHIKQAYPDHRVIWNDFDNYQQRLDKIDETNLLRQKLYPLCTREKKGLKLDKETKNLILATIRNHENAGYFTDYITLSSWLLFSGSYEKSLTGLAKHAFYSSRVVGYDINVSGYLSGVQRTSEDFRELMDRYKNQQKILILDPPYLQTQSEVAYKNCWELSKFLQLMDRIKPPYLLFGSHKSSILYFFEYMEDKNKSVFYDYKLVTKKLSLQVCYTDSDYLLYKVAA